ncbi:putative competence-damage inducible protein [Luteitalea sp. TBR-22]|uniref:competence/damage-inducible protein A n=1 Tax=Luteitalea sp. TBR-22 TaxID=2802971 RepID=UPI001AF5C5AA|nr:competence/damage-inducible protein A [Luteitalea sp. TBR-22]BCS33902.1 putative competence-damage inducible protein [Luteitalea sp. TBR-22]
MSPAAFARAETIAVGSELLALGRVDTNSGHIAARLAALGIDVVARSVVGDHAGHLELAVRTALQRADLVVLTGGLGPTDDDLTRQAVSAALGRPMHEDAEQLARIAARFAARAIPMPALNRRQALLIEGALRLDNPNGTAPGQWIDVGAQAVVLLPGPPREMAPMLELVVDGPLAARAGRARTYTRGLKVAGRSESAVEATLLPLYAEWRTHTPAIEATILAALGRIELHLFVRGEEEAPAVAALEAAIAQAAEALGPAVYTTRDESLEELAGRLLREAGWRVAVVESCTGGMLGARMTDVPGSSAWLEGGVITYSNALKTELAGVPAPLIAEHGAVSEPVARAMAAGARTRCRSEVGIGITGIAGPDGGTEAKPVGTVFIAIETPTIAACRQARFVGDRAVVRQQSVSAALDMLRLALTGHDPVGAVR